MPVASPTASGSSLIPIPEPRGGGASGRSAAGCRGLLRQRTAQLPATRHAELVVDVAEMGLDGLARHEQDLRDLGIAAPLGRQLRDAALRYGQLPRPSAEQLARPAPRGAQLRAGPLGERAGAAALGEIQPVLERAARLGAVVATPQG